MSKLTIYTYDWLPEFPRGFVRDLRARWVAEETGRDYEIATVPVHPKSDAHKAMQPFAQVPMIEDGDVSLFETGAIVLHLAEGSALLPEAMRSEITQWVIAALNSLEPMISNWMTSQLSKDMPDIFGPPASEELEAQFLKSMNARLAAMEKLLADDREWIAGDFSAADIILVDVLRQAGDATKGYPALTAYIERATARPAFKQAMADHMKHWEDADAAKAAQAG
ncbi:glutathione S-transferase family protein [Paracoccus aurantiacus]|uniref:Glutathione S-transferase family protein n=1 Tax=Paracoccus aurantiacus TaxID=2599412 RepID=A0A5C6S799_9RHOB|nr:glutathione S-transferase family protein [Paracoccus aurantiacus]TXB69652.1 glutathione S-transferase family protein [Paracoccus aurantiacus]